MFDIGFSEILLVLVLGLIVLGPERLPVAIKTVAGWIRALRSLATTVQSEIAQELKLQELQESLKKVEQAGIEHVSPELKASFEELKSVTDSIKQAHQQKVTSAVASADPDPQEWQRELENDQPVEPTPVAPVEAAASSSADVEPAASPAAVSLSKREPSEHNASSSSSPHNDR